MASRPKGYGMTAEQAAKKDSNFDPDLSNEAMTWIADVLKTGSDEDLDAAEVIREKLRSEDFITQAGVENALKSGQELCRLMNVLKPGSVKKINTNKLAFKQMENIGNFLGACESIGMNKIDLFQTVDLYEGVNIPQVINGIFALGRKAQKFYDGPRLGPEEATANKREFTEEQLRAGEAVIGLQAGSNKGASQAGQNFGKTRAIID